MARSDEMGRSALVARPPRTQGVPLELGKYHDNTWREDVKTLAEFIDEHMVPSISGRAPSDDVAYLAQHQLVDQLSDLSSDLSAASIARNRSSESTCGWARRERSRRATLIRTIICWGRRV